MYDCTLYNLNGLLHREDGPAIEHKDGTKEYFINGKRHRQDGPAVIDFDGNEMYWVNGLLHREGGPAINKRDTKEYYVNGKRHRIDGPAVETVGFKDGSFTPYIEYYLCGKKYSHEDWLKARKLTAFL